MTKSELIAKIAEKADRTQAESGHFLNAILATFQDVLQDGGSIPLIGFGTFTTVDRPARMGNNPQKPGEKMQIAASKNVKFKVGSKLKEAVNA